MIGENMKICDCVEQAIHSVTMLAGLSSSGVLSAAALAEFHGVSASYLLKHLQALSGAGIVQTLPGPKGGYRFARQPAKITLPAIVLARSEKRRVGTACVSSCSFRGSPYS